MRRENCRRTLTRGMAYAALLCFLLFLYNLELLFFRLASVYNSNGLVLQYDRHGISRCAGPYRELTIVD